MRGVIPLDAFAFSSRPARTVRSDAFTITVNTASSGDIRLCRAQPGRDDTWIKQTHLRDLYIGLS